MPPDDSEYQPLNVDDSDMVTPPAPKKVHRSVRIGLLFVVCLVFFGLASQPMGQYDISHHHMDSEESERSEKLGTVYSVACEPTVENVECGFIIVPKNHLNDTVGTAKVAFARYKAKKSPRKGSVFMNPGGPGHPGMHLAMDKGAEMANIIGEDWDLIGFDPRGVGKTTPSTRCFPDIQSYRDMFANTVVERGITVPSIADLSSKDLHEALLLQYEELLSLKRAQADMCREHMGEELAYMGSVTVARDIEYMSRILEGQDAKVNYWGESYGSVIGSFLVNMFPERIGHVVIDGIVNPVLLTSEPTHKWPTNWLSDTEKTYQVFLNDCSKAGPQRCALSLRQGEPPETIERRLEFFFDETARRPIPVSNGNRPGVLTSGTARALLLITLQNPNHWSTTARNFAEAMKGNATALYNLHVPPPVTPNASFTDVLPPFTPDLQRQAITCLDAPAPYPPDEAYPSAEDYAEQGLFTLRSCVRSLNPCIIFFYDDFMTPKYLQESFLNDGGIPVDPTLLMARITGSYAVRIWHKVPAPVKAATGPSATIPDRAGNRLYGVDISLLSDLSIRGYTFLFGGDTKELASGY
uniref:AB hydrolase-1 domain-containing protein n=1 Tax=Moniliophthora roreri TaxID=221103 RepID=A0A0W0FJM3_MONRR